MPKNRTVEELRQIALEIGESLMKHNLSAQEAFYVLVLLQADSIGSLILKDVKGLMDERDSGIAA